MLLRRSWVLLFEITGIRLIQCGLMLLSWWLMVCMFNSGHFLLKFYCKRPAFHLSDLLRYLFTKGLL